MKEVKQRKKDIAMAWLDYRKAYDLVPHSWLNECLSMFDAVKKVKNLLTNSTKEWNTMLKTCWESIFEIKFARGIFQRDTLSPLMFVIAMIPWVLRKVSTK